MKKFLKKCKDFFFRDGFMTKKDYIILSILMIVFTILVFFRLGNTYAPQTTYETTLDDRDIIIDFGDYINVDKLHIYLGNLDSRQISLSAFNEVTQEWEVIQSDLSVGSVFQWNTFNIYYNLRYLGIVSSSETAVFNEFVFTDPDGNVITPVNTDRYPTLFDEQEMFYKTTEKTYMDGTMFDEVYHGRTGYEFVHGLPTYETTHPQLGKCFIALGIKIFGMTPFGWRFFSVIFGIIFIPLMYTFAKRLSDDTFIATCVGIFITFDCMHYTLSRIATIDIYVAFFIIMAYYYMYKYIQYDTAYRTGTLGLNLSYNKPCYFKKLIYKLLKKDPNSTVKNFKSSSISGCYNCQYDKFPPKEVYMPLALSGIGMAMAIATKLTGVYAGVGLAILLIAHLIKYPPKKQTMRLFFFCFTFFIICTIVIYTLAYIPSVEYNASLGITDKSIKWDENGLNIGYGWTGLIAKTARNTNYMIHYHTTLDAEHYYSSPWYEWPIIWMPLLAANDAVNATGDVSSVSYIGNIAIWWFGIPCILFCAFRAILRKDKVARFLIISYLAQYVPWMLVKRCIFIYHYFPAALFTMFMIGHTIKITTEHRPYLKKYVDFYLGLVILVFILFFPVISGLPFSKEWGLSLRLLPDWILVL